MQDFFVYVFVNHNTGNPVYIGKGIRNRETQHQLNASRGQDSRFYRWMRKYKRLNNVWPKLFKLAEGLTEKEAFDYEKSLIAFYGRVDKKTGCLFNHTNGGEGISGYSFPREVVDKRANKNRGRKLSPESIAKRTASVLGSKRSAETKRKISLGNKGKKTSPETRAKMSLALKGRKVSAETRAKISAAGKKRPSGNKGHKGYTISAEGRANMSVSAKINGARPEVRAKISAAMKGKPSWNRGNIASAETRAKMSAAHKGVGRGKVVSSETRVKMSSAQKNRYQRERRLLAA